MYCFCAKSLARFNYWLRFNYFTHIGYIIGQEVESTQAT